MKIGFGLGLDVSNKNPRGGNDPAFDAVLAEGISNGDTLPSNEVQAAGNQLVLDLKSAGIWDKLDVMYVLATDGDAAFAEINWKSPSNFRLTQIGSPTFTSLQGFAGDAATDLPMLDMGWNAEDNGVNYTQNDASLSVYIRNNTDDGGYVLHGSTTRAALRSGEATNRINDIGSPSFDTSGNGWYHYNRVDASNSNYIYQNNTPQYESIGSISITSGGFSLLSRIGQSVGSSSQISFASLGGNLTSEASDFYTAVTTYLSTIGSI